MQRYNYEIEYLIDFVKEEHNYLSETKKEVLNNVKGNYPQLSTYESEWIYFNATGYNAGEPVEIEYQTVEGTDGTVKNAIPFHYKSASLKGQTLVNLFNVDDSLSLEHFNDRWKYQNEINNLIGGNKYYVYFFNKLNNFPLHIKPLNTTGEKGAFNVEANTGKVVTLDSSIFEALGYYYYKDGWTGDESKQDIIDNCKILFFEYQEGMENWDISYFEGMQSVQKPVLTTTGKNLFDITKNCNYNYDENAYEMKLAQRIYLPFKENTKYAIKGTFKNSNNGVNARLSIKYTDGTSEDFPISNTDEYKTSIVISNSNKSINYLVATYNNGTGVLYVKDLQIEEGSVATSYEPYQSNILTVNEEVELRGIGDVQDELNLLTGEVIERIGEIVLDGSEDWDYMNGTFRSMIISDKVFKQLTAIDRVKIYLTCANYKSINYESTWDSGKFIALHISKEIVFRDERFATVDEWIQYLSQNPLTLQYVLATESVKTVDLTSICRPFEGVNHFTTSSDTIAPNMILEIPVVSTGKQTLQEINK